MHVSHGFRSLLGLSLVILLSGPRLALSQQPSQSGPSAGTAELRWTPHRAASSPQAVTTDTSATTAPAAVLATAATPSVPLAASQPPAPLKVPTATRIAASPASVGLPAGVPPVAAAQRRQTPKKSLSPAQSRTRVPGPSGDWNSDNRLPGPMRSSGRNDQITMPNMPNMPNMPSLGDITVFRAPQGEAGRPVLAVEGTPSRPAVTPTAAPLGGGLAPRYTATRPASQRRERLAMNADGLPSVMTRAPQAAAIDNTVAPDRLPSPGMPDSPMTSADPSIVINTMPGEVSEYGPEDFGSNGFEGEGYDPSMASADGGMWMGEYPTQLHVESFYDDPFACEESSGFMTCWPCDGRVCAWLRQFGKPYYGWRWYRDFTAGAGITSFQNQSNFGLLGNYGTNEYLNWSMPFWNAFGVGWQLGARGVQTNFQQPTLNEGTERLRTNSRQQVFVTTGFFTRAFEGRGLQGGAVYDYLSDSYVENVDVSQIRGELSYVWGYHELGFWGAFNAMEQQGVFDPRGTSRGMASTVDLYTAFYRLHFGDANEARIWGGASGNGQGVIGSQIRAPMSRSLAMEGTFTYLLPDKSQTIQLGPATSVTFAPSAWNLSVNLVWYPAGRARRSLASPYRPLFDVADNGSMIRAISRLPTP